MMNMLETVNLLHKAASLRAERFNEMGFQQIGWSPNEPIAYFSDRADPCPVVIEYRVNRWAVHSFRVTVRGLVMGIAMASPWVQTIDLLIPRVNRMKFYADALRKAYPNAPNE